MNKGSILRASVDHIRHLQRERDMLFNQQQTSSQQLQQMQQRIKQLEGIMQVNKLKVLQSTKMLSKLQNYNVPVPTNQFPVHQVKQEPPDEPNSYETNDGRYCTVSEKADGSHLIGVHYSQSSTVRQLRNATPRSDLVRTRTAIQCA